MPKKKSIPSIEPLISRPQRNTRAKKVFDPSYLPKKRNKPTVKYDKPNETSKKNNYEKKKTQDTKSKSNQIDESLDCSSNDITDSLEHCLSNSTIIDKSPELYQESSNLCFLCTKCLLESEIVDCPICLLKAHKNCILVDEPMWKFKLDKCVWLCRQCRKKHCSKCLEDDSLLEISRRCITCKVGLHLNCYESYDIKPLHTLQINMYVCIPCMTLAIHKIPEEEDEVEEEEDLLLEEEKDMKEEESEIKIGVTEEESEKKLVIEEESEKKEETEKIEVKEENDIGKEVEEDTITDNSTSHSVVIISSDEENDDNDLRSFKSFDSLLDYDREQDSISRIPDISNWSKYQVYEYLTEKLPKEILAKIIKNDIDGQALKLLKRTDITFGMGLKLGPALKLYKEIRILQSQSTYHGVYWE